MKRHLKRMISGVFSYFRLSKLKKFSCGIDSSLIWWRVQIASGKASLSIGAASVVEGRITFERDGAEILIGERTFVGNCVISCANQLLLVSIA